MVVCIGWFCCGGCDAIGSEKMDGFGNYIQEISGKLVLPWIYV